MNRTRAASPITLWRLERAARFGSGWPALSLGLAGPDFVGACVFMGEMLPSVSWGGNRLASQNRWEA